MTKSAASTLARLESRLHEQMLDVSNLRTALDVQRNRLSRMFVQLDVMPPARRRRQSFPALLNQHSSNNRNRYAAAKR